MEEDFITRPPANATGSEWPRIQKIDFSPCKTPADYVNFLTAAILEEKQASFKLGFHYYDNEQKMSFRLKELSFVVLESFSQITGRTKDNQGNYTNWYSNRIKDSRKEKFVVWNGGPKSVLSGLWEEIKGPLKVMAPQGVSFNIHLICYCFQTDGIIDIRMSQTVERQVKRAMLEADGKEVNDARLKKVNLFTIANNDLLWGFRLKTFTRQNVAGYAYPRPPEKPNGDCYFAPVFKAGTVQPIGNTAALHAKCCEMQEEIRAAYRAQVAKYGQGQNGQTQTQAPAPSGNGNGQQTQNRPATAPPNKYPWPEDGDDLPY